MIKVDLSKETIERELAKESLKHKTEEELIEWLSLSQLETAGSFGKALHEAARELLLEKAEKIILEDE